eukprot:TRINITY_DN15373_c0_g1_i2.p1 TRINITY_DN15373_c0_g1~~TRINITY_DN15373_c0_g1_i2.p1  ORF type:complete len:713 (-),score=62.82 TRINITY_DN15373_c0_g1_i2:50-2110(-)
MPRVEASSCHNGQTLQPLAAAVDPGLVGDVSKLWPALGGDASAGSPWGATRTVSHQETKVCSSDHFCGTSVKRVLPCHPIVIGEDDEESCQRCPNEAEVVVSSGIKPGSPILSRTRQWQFSDSDQIRVSHDATVDMEIENSEDTDSELPKDTEIQDQFRRLSSNTHELSSHQVWRIMAVMGEMSKEPYPPLDETITALKSLIARTARWLSTHCVLSEAWWRGQRINEDTFMGLMKKEYTQMGLPWPTVRALNALRKGVLFESRFHLAQVASNSEITSPIDDGTLMREQNVDKVSTCIIALNTLVIGVSGDVSPMHPFWDFCEYFFVTFFFAEIVIKVRLFGWKYFIHSKQRCWNLFDILVVALAIADGVVSFLSYRGQLHGLEGLTAVKVLRFSRLARLVRVLRYRIFDDLKSMIHGVISGSQVLGWAILLFLFTVYVVAVSCRKAIDTSSDPEYWSSDSFENIPTAMFTVFRCFTSGCTATDGTPLEVHFARRYGPIFMLVYVLIMLSVNIGVSNLIMALFIDKVMTASQGRNQRERGSNAAAMEWKLHSLVSKLLEEMETNTRKRRPNNARTSLLEQKTITREVFQVWLQNKEMIRLLDELDISVGDQNSIFDLLDVDLSGELHVCEVVEGLMSIRGSFEKVDIVATRIGIRHLTRIVEELVGKSCAIKHTLSRESQQSVPSET